MTLTVEKTSVKLLFMTMIMALMLPFSFAFMDSVQDSSMTAFADDKNGNGDIPEVSIDGGKVSFGENSAFQKSGSGAWNTLLSKYRNVIVGVSGIAAITMVVIFIVNFLKLGASAGNPNARSAALTGLMWSGIAAAGLGAVSLIVGIFYNAIDSDTK